MTNILRIDSSARTTGSVTRDLTDQIVNRFAEAGDVNVVTRDLADGLPLLTETWVTANFTPAAARDASQTDALAISDTLIGEIQEADVLVIGLPIYNFGAPAALKAWIDQVARAGVTFQYTPKGPVGLLEGKRAVIAVASGGVETGSAADYASTHLRQVLAFIGITDVSVVRADKLNIDPEAANAQAAADLNALSTAA